MDPVDPQTQLWIAVAGAAAAGVLALLGSVLGNYLTHSSEHARWKRDKRYEVYLRCLTPIVQLEKKLLYYYKDGHVAFEDLPVPHINDYPLGEWEVWMSKEARDAGIAAFLAYLHALNTVMQNEAANYQEPVSIPLLDEYKEKFIKQVKKDLKIR